MLDDDYLRESYERTTSTSPDAAQHLDQEAWERLACGEMSPFERRGAIDHLTGCPQCARVYRGLSLLEEEARAVDPRLPLPTSAAMERTRRQRSWLLWPALATAAVLVVLLARPVGLPVGDPEPAPADPLRSVPGAARPRPLSPTGALAEPPASLAWEGVPGAAAYRVEVLGADGELIWESGTVAETTVAWPLEPLDEPGRYYWRVLALPEIGGDPEASPLVAFDLRPAGG